MTAALRQRLAWSEKHYAVAKRWDLLQIAREFALENERLRDACARAEADYRSLSRTLAAHSMYGSAREARNAADYLEQVLAGQEEESCL